MNEKMIPFNIEKIIEDIIQWIQDWFRKNGKKCNCIIGLSGGKDSTITAALLCRALGPDRVIGVGMPSVGQNVNEADLIAKKFGMKFIYAPIGNIVETFLMEKNNLIEDDKWHFDFSQAAEQNIPARIRMTMLYAIAQSCNGRVVNTSNYSENWLGYSTKYGDMAGDFSVLGDLTVTEIKAIAHYLDLPDEWIEKRPEDGLPHSCPDEIKFGFTYEELDKYIRDGIEPEKDIKKRMDAMHKENKHKEIKIPKYKFKK